MEMTESKVKQIIAEMILKKEIKFYTAGNPNVGQSLYIEFDINESDYHCFEVMELENVNI